jgi:hypothetical protein
VLKNLLLFFEGTAILLPRYMSGCEPSLTRPLAEKGLVRVLESETFVDQEMTESLIAAVTELVQRGVCICLPPESGALTGISAGEGQIRNLGHLR